MYYVFYVLGALTFLVGAAWTGLLLANAQGISIAIVVAAAPGLTFMGSGLGLLAIGSGLNYLRKITRNTADTADAIEALLKGVAK